VVEAKACPGSPSGLHGTILITAHGQPVRRFPVVASQMYSVNLDPGNYVLTYGSIATHLPYPEPNVPVTVHAGTTTPVVEVWPLCP
jgi:hypothetical protein